MANLIVGVARNRVIGQGLKIPWHYPDDLKWFKENTMGGVLIMGRKTYESLPRKLPGREMIVLSRSSGAYSNQSATLGDALYFAGTRWLQQQVWIIGGSSVYQEAININAVSRAYVTEIPDFPPVDEETIFFPEGLLDNFELINTIVNNNLVHKIYQNLNQ